nr:hypothetical protein PanWU01x14_154200 [Ipomoea batatas]
MLANADSERERVCVSYFGVKALKAERNANLDPGRSEPEDPDFSPDIAEDPQLDPVVNHSVADQSIGISLEQADPIHHDGGLDPADTVGGLVESGDDAPPEWNSAVHDGLRASTITRMTAMTNNAMKVKRRKRQQQQPLKEALEEEEEEWGGG